MSVLRILNVSPNGGRGYYSVLTSCTFLSFYCDLIRYVDVSRDKTVLLKVASTMKLSDLDFHVGRCGKRRAHNYRLIIDRAFCAILSPHKVP